MSLKNVFRQASVSGAEMECRFNPKQFIGVEETLSILGANSYISQLLRK
jgi:hypothetical protein